MSNIKIDWLSDTHDCDTCGFTVADGAKVYIDGDLALDLSPVAYCYDGVSHSETQVLARLLEHLGHTVEQDYYA